MRLLETALSVATLGAFLWVVFYQLPKARREHDRFALICSILTALLTLFGWLFFGIAAQSG